MPNSAQIEIDHNLSNYKFCSTIKKLVYTYLKIILFTVLEYVGPKWRTFVANMSIALFFTCASSGLPWIAYYLADWRMTAIATSLPLALAVATPWCVPESARWLVSQGKVEKAIKILNKFERINRNKIPDQVYKDFRVCNSILRN